MSDRKNNFDFSRQSWPKQPSAERVVGERGRKELPPGTKGGENMKPDRHAEHKQHAFDSFCKKVLKCEACNGYREISRRKKHSMRDTAASRNNLLPYPVITAAVQGDPDAVNRVIGHYSGYIAALSTRTSYDPQGCPHSQVDDDLRRRLETKLIIAILDFDLT